MKSVLVLTFVFACAAAALARPLPPLPTSEFADTEVTVCHPLDQTMPRVCGLTFALTFRGTSSSNVEITFGAEGWEVARATRPSEQFPAPTRE